MKRIILQNAPPRIPPSIARQYSRSIPSYSSSPRVSRIGSRAAPTVMNADRRSVSTDRIRYRRHRPRCMTTATFPSRMTWTHARGNTSRVTVTAGLALYDSLDQTCKPIPVAIMTDDHGDDCNRRDETTSDHESRDKRDSISSSSSSSRYGSKGIAWYTCGPTVYDSAHLGHARTYVSIDILQRCLVYAHKMQSIVGSLSGSSLPPSPPPVFIMNITNVDDKILARAKERGMSPRTLAKHYEGEFWKDMDDLNVMRPTIVTRVTDHVESSIIPYIERIVANGMAYRIDKDGVYFDVEKFEELTGRFGKRNRYGKLAPTGQSTVPVGEETLFSWEKPRQVSVSLQSLDDGDDNDGDVNNNSRKKKDPRDFVLWKNRSCISQDNDGNGDGDGANMENEEMLWDSPWGKGRPGWHIECSAMIESTMQLDFMRDYYKLHVHAGGVDLKFPHHTNEIAQAEAYHYHYRSNYNDDSHYATKDYHDDANDSEKEEWIPHWVHTGHLHIDGLKMSKSLKNFITIREILGSNDGPTAVLESPADDFRMWCLGLSGSYRSAATYSKSRLEEAKAIRQKIVRFLVDGEEWKRGRGNRDEDDVATSKSPLAMKSWTRNEFDLLQQANICQIKCHEIALGLGCDGSGMDQEQSLKEFDGSSYLNALLSLSDAGSRYMATTMSAVRDTSSSTVAVEQSLHILRECLANVGFSDKTVKAGIGSWVDDHTGNDDSHKRNSSSRIFVEHLVDFRKTVRALALHQLKQNGKGGDSHAPSQQQLAKDLLALCDKWRNEDLPKIGLEVFDSSPRAGPNPNPNTATDWRFIIPRDSVAHPTKDSMESTDQQQRPAGAAPASSQSPPVPVTESNFFKVGPYAGQFSAFDDTGLPTHDSKGVELSKRRLKKLLKKKTAYFDKNNI